MKMAEGAGTGSQDDAVHRVLTEYGSRSGDETALSPRRALGHSRIR